MMRAHSHRKQLPQQSRIIENRIFISSSHLGPLSNNIASKLDLIKQQISKQLRQKLPNQGRKTNTSIKKAQSTSKMRSNTITPVPTRLNFDQPPTPANHEYREKFYQTNQQLIHEKKKQMQTQSQLQKLKFAIIGFIQQLNNDSAQVLTKLLDKSSQKVQKAVENLLGLSERQEQYKKIIQEIMDIMQINDIQSLLNELSSKLEKFNTLDSLTFQILQLQSAKNKLSTEYQHKINQLKQKNSKLMIENNRHCQQQMNMLTRKNNQLEKQLYSQKQNHKMIKNDLKLITKNWNNKQMIWNSDSFEIRDVHRIIINLQLRMEQIEREAEENNIKMIKSSEHLKKLQENFQHFKQQNNIHAEEEKHKIIIIQNQIKKLQQIINEKDQIIKNQQLRIQNMVNSSVSRQNQMKKIQQEQRNNFIVLCKMINVDQNSSWKQLTSNIFDIKQKISSNEQFILWYQKELSNKQTILKQLQITTQKLLSQTQRLKIANKNIILQKDQYQYLLNVKRQEVLTIKKQHNQQLQKLIKQKDQQLVLSNKDILEINLFLNNENQLYKQKWNKLLKQTQQIRNQRQFNKKKIQQYQKSFKEKDIKIYKLEQQNEKSKNQMKEFEISLKQLQNIYEQNYSKVAYLEKQTQTLKTKLENQIKMKNLIEVQYNNILQQFNIINTDNIKLKNSLQDLKIKYQDNQKKYSDYRLNQLQKQTQIRQNLQQAKQTKKENKQLLSQKNKLVQKINALTKKIIYNSNKVSKPQQNKVIKLISKDIEKFKSDYSKMKISINQSFKQMNSYYQKQYSQFINQIVLFIKKPQKKNKQTQTQLTKQNIINNIVLSMKSQLQDVKQSINIMNSQLFAYRQQIQNQIQNITNDIKIKQSLKLKYVKNLKNTFNQIKSIKYQFTELKKVTVEFGTNIKNQIIHNQIQISQKINYLIKNKSFYDQYDNQQQLLNDVFDSPCKNQRKLSVEEKQTPKLGLIQYKVNKQNSYEVNQSYRKNIQQIIQKQCQETNFKQVRNVIQILTKLIENDSQYPKIPYFQEIKVYYQRLKKIINKKNLNLDISAVEAKPNTASSCSSFSFCKQLGFDKRMLTDNIVDQIRDTNRSEKTPHASQINKNYNQLKIQIKQLTQEYKLLKQKYQQLNDQKNQIQKRNTQLQNASSTKTIQKLFNKFIENLLQEKLSQMEDCMRIILKVLGNTHSQIQAIQQAFNKRKKKKNTNNFFSGFFK